MGQVQGLVFTQGITRIANSLRRLVHAEVSLMDLDKDNIHINSITYTHQTARTQPRFTEPKCNTEKVKIYFGTKGFPHKPSLTINEIATAMKWSRDKALGLISNWPIDKMIVAFDYQEPNTLWEFYNNPSNTKKTGTINAIAKKIVEFESSGWISSLKYCSNDNPPKASFVSCWQI